MYHTLSGSRPPVFRLFTTFVAVSDAAFFVAFLGGIFIRAESTTTSSYGLVSSDTRCDSPGFGDSPRSPYQPAVAVTSLPALARPVMPRTHRVSVTRPVRELTRFPGWRFWRPVSSPRRE